MRRAALVLALVVAGTAHAGPAGTVAGTVRVLDVDGRPATGVDVIVYITGFDEPPGREIPQIEQRGRKFVPSLLAVTLGEAVAFPNGDPFLHNVFSLSPTRKFDLGSFKRGETKARTFSSLGTVDVYCNIHPEMAATILVLPNRRHARVKPDGSFVIDGVKPGTWKVYAYARRAPTTSKPIAVAAGETVTVELVMTRGGGGDDHVNKYGEKYKGPGGTYR